MDIVGFIKSSLIFISIMGAAMWLGVLWKSEGEDRLRETCLPFEFATSVQHRVVSTVLGYEPTWTLKAQRYLVSRCYYVTTRVALTQQALSGDNYGSIGGIHRF